MSASKLPGCKRALPLPNLKLSSGVLEPSVVEVCPELSGQLCQEKETGRLAVDEGWSVYPCLCACAPACVPACVYARVHVRFVPFAPCTCAHVCLTTGAAVVALSGFEGKAIETVSGGTGPL